MLTRKQIEKKKALSKAFMDEREKLEGWENKYWELNAAVIDVFKHLRKLIEKDS